MAGLGKRDLLIASSFSVIFLILAALNLGLVRAPNTYLQVEGRQDIQVTFESNRTIGSLYLLTSSDSGMGLNIYVQKNDAWESDWSLDKSGYYMWKKVDLGVTVETLRLSFVSWDLKIYEIVGLSPSGDQLTIRSGHLEGSNSSDAQWLFDEQDYFENPPTFLSETYFDEIYFVRAAQDYLDLHEPFEWTHPPLGKLILALGIMAFSFSPFGWRIVGVLFAALMIPMIYLFSKKVYKSTFAAAVSSLLLTFDFLHFTMARMGTVDTYLIFFSMVSALFFYLNFESLANGGKPIYKFIFLGILSFSLSFAVKWTAVYGFVGQITLMIALGLKNFKYSNHEFLSMIKSISRSLAIILFSLVVGGLVYVSTFVPYMLIGHDPADIYQAQWSMYNYHAGLTATHPFSSEWWMWPVIVKPLWLYNTQLPQGMVSTITAMGNPVVWWFGLPFTILAIWKGLRKGEKSYLFISVLFMFQWLPYALISRTLFIYHYYPAVPMMIIASAGILSDWWRDPKERRLVQIYLVAVVAVFALFYPVISGYPIPYWYKESLQWLRSWTF